MKHPRSLAAALALSTLALASEARAQETVIAPIAVAPAELATVGFTSAGEPVTVRVAGPTAPVDSECRTPCVLRVVPGSYALESGAPHPRRIDNVQVLPGAQTFEVRPHGPNYGVGLGLTIGGGALIGSALATTLLFTATGGGFGLFVIGLFVGVPGTVVGLGLLIPGAVVLSNNGPAHFEQVAIPSRARAGRRREGFGLASSFVRDEQGAAHTLVGLAF